MMLYNIYSLHTTQIIYAVISPSVAIGILHRKYTIHKNVNQYPSNLRYVPSNHVHTVHMYIAGFVVLCPQ